MRMRIAALMLLSAACATTGGAGGGPASRFHQADYRGLPELREVAEEGERAKISDARIHANRGMEANQSGNQDQARAEWGTAADMLASFAERFPSSGWRIVARYQAAKLYWWSQQPEKAALQCEKLLDDKEGNDVTKAAAAHLAAAAWQNLANVQTKIGKLEPIKLATAEQRRNEPLRPRSPPGAWKNYVEAADVYLEKANSDPELKKPAAERFVSTGAAQLALIAAEVEYGFDNMENARGRFSRIIRTWPAEPEVMDGAVNLYLQTFLVMKEREGYRQALGSVKQIVAEAQAKAASSGDAASNSVLAKVRDRLAVYEQGAKYDEATALLEQGRPVDAANAFDKVAIELKGTPDGANALFNAAIAWNKAGEPAKAIADLQAIVGTAEYAKSKVMPSATLMLAQALSTKKDRHAEAAKLYAEFLERWPDSDNRCIPLQNLGYEYDVEGKKAEAANRYVAFATDAKCGKGDPNAAAKALVRAGKLYGDVRQKAKAREALEKAIAVQGVTDTVAKSQIEEAKRALRK